MASHLYTEYIIPWNIWSFYLQLYATTVITFYSVNYFPLFYSSHKYKFKTSFISSWASHYTNSIFKMTPYNVIEPSLWKNKKIKLLYFLLQYNLFPRHEKWNTVACSHMIVSFLCKLVWLHFIHNVLWEHHHHLTSMSLG